ncbi:MAG: SGNH/GDSL hydrolase family protein, partial [Tepidisphaerales bacterium]
MLTANHRLLFIGDSITDCGRTDPSMSKRDPIGIGYVRFIQDYLLARDPANAPLVINRGISGNKVTDLAERWERDVLAEKPDWVSVKIGINDVWHGYKDASLAVPIERFRTVYADLLRQTKAALPRVKLVLCQPTVIGPAAKGARPVPVESGPMLFDGVLPPANGASPSTPPMGILPATPAPLPTPQPLPEKSQSQSAPMVAQRPPAPTATSPALTPRCRAIRSRSSTAAM